MQLKFHCMHEWWRKIKVNNLSIFLCSIFNIAPPTTSSIATTKRYLILSIWHSNNFFIILFLFIPSFPHQVFIQVLLSSRKKHYNLLRYECMMNDDERLVEDKLSRWCKKSDSCKWYLIKISVSCWCSLLQGYRLYTLFSFIYYPLLQWNIFL